MPSAFSRRLPPGADPAEGGRGRGGSGARGGGALLKPGEAAAAAAAVEGAGAAVSEAAKKHKAIGKKLRQIAELREAAEAGKPLEKNQLDKIEQAAGLEAELAALTLELADEGKTGRWRE
ncbi:hypothetical protein T492DRAFT_839964 [Pavlovales sp. CCMP2436]|nr:hypothetical protein T492DRAFT_839964 [Pavlovales sp. CCMP2436]